MFLLQPRKTSEAQVLENLNPEKQVLEHVTRGISSWSSNAAAVPIWWFSNWVNFYPKKTLGKCYLSRGVKTERASELRHMSLRQNAGEPSAWRALSVWNINSQLRWRKASRTYTMTTDVEQYSLHSCIECEDMVQDVEERIDVAEKK